MIHAGPSDLFIISNRQPRPYGRGYYITSLRASGMTSEIRRIEGLAPVLTPSYLGSRRSGFSMPAIRSVKDSTYKLVSYCKSIAALRPSSTWLSSDEFNFTNSLGELGAIESGHLVTEGNTLFTESSCPCESNTAEGPRPACATEVESGTTMIDLQLWV
jgi:hypothetical protein